MAQYIFGRGQICQIIFGSSILILAGADLQWCRDCPWGSGIPLSDVNTTGPAPVTTEYSEIIGFLSEEPPESTLLTVIISSESWNVTRSIWRITVNLG